jgi:light-regulated signal transduction histidine kinase (bacteriophytochrome)
LDEVLGRSATEFWQTGDQAANVIEQLQKTGGWLGELEARRKDGSRLQVQVSASMITDPEGQVTGTMASFLDITERKRLEEELVTKAEELARSNTELEQFAYVASHDLQEPLRMVSSYVQLLARRYQGALGQEADEFIQYAVDGAARMQALIQDLLAYSRVGGSGTKLVPVDCEKVLSQTLIDMQITITEAGATITHEPLPVIRFDPVQFAQILQNLISNAIKFRRPEVPPIVAISAVEHSEEWLFSVKDNGLGVSDLFLKKAFQIFQRWQARGESPGTGTGIGLAVCRRIVERFGGRIWIESKVGEGSTFYFTIPLKSRSQIGER